MLYREKDYLAHYGVKGMRWGHRKQYKDSVRSARQRMYDRQDKAENWHENKVMSINNKYKQYGNNLTGKNARMDRKTKKAYSNEHDKATKQFKSDKKQAKTVYKQSEANRKQAIKSTYREMRENATTKEKLLYNNATRKLAAKYVVNNNMSVSDAKKAANKVAIRNTALILGAYGATTMVELYKLNKR